MINNTRDNIARDIQLLINAVSFGFVRKNLIKNSAPNTLRSSVYDLHLSSLQPDFMPVGIVNTGILTRAHCKQIPVFCMKISTYNR